MTICVKCGEDFTAETGTCELCSNEVAKPFEIPFDFSMWFEHEVPKRKLVLLFDNEETAKRAFELIRSLKRTPVSKIILPVEKIEDLQCRN